MLAEGADLSIAAELIDEDYLRRHVPRVVNVLAGELTYIKGGIRRLYKCSCTFIEHIGPTRDGYDLWL